MSDPLSRRAFVLGCSAAALAVPLAVTSARRAAAAAPAMRGVDVRPRSDWAEGLPVPEALAEEAPGDVRLLVVHHSASANGYAADDVPGILRGFHALHTGPERGWPDVAYNFFVDAAGTVWEGRAGSLAGPVQPDATGGSQGWSQICCFVGDHTTEPPTAAAQRSMTRLLAALARRYDVPPDATTTFVSRGSSRWPEGATVTTHTIAGHRDVSLTSCPGDAAYALVQTAFPAEVAATLAARATPSAPATTPAAAPSTPSRAPAAPPSSSAAASVPRSPEAAARQDDGAAGPSTVGWVAAGGAVVSGAAAVLARHLRRRPAGRHRAEG